MSVNPSQPNGYEVSDLLREIEVKDQIIARQGEMIASLTRAASETFNASMEALRNHQPGKETNAFFVESERIISRASPDDLPFVILARVNAAAAMVRDHKPAALVTEGPDLLHYDIRNLNDRRRDAILSYMEKTGKSSITTQEARHVLQTAEGRQLDRKAVWRALIAARGVLGATTDILGGVLRLIVPSSPRPGDHRHVAAGGGGERDTSPRSRRWSVPWDGED